MNINPTETNFKDLISRHNILPKKKWGQNFLIDKNLLDIIADSCQLSPKDYAVEIGAGFGALTERLCRRSKGVLSVEIDKALEAPLKEILADYSNSRILFADVLEVNIEEELKKEFQLDIIPAYKVCANIPYNITTPIIFTLLEHCPHLQTATLMMQKEVAERIKASTGSKDYGLLTIMIQFYADVEHVRDISKNCFVPRPQVDSTVIRITPRLGKYKVKDEKIFKGLTRLAFQMRRKMILNSCSKYFNLDKNICREKLEIIHIDPHYRPENLTVDDYIKIADALG